MSDSHPSRAPRNRTLILTPEEREHYRARLSSTVDLDAIGNRVLCADFFEIMDRIPDASADLIFADPPYNLDRTFNGRPFAAMSSADYAAWLDTWLPALRRIARPTASLYLCCDWRSSAAVHQVAEKYFTVRNRITWERDKGRGAARNWKNCAEDIFFCTVSDDYHFDLDAVKLKRRVLAPYTDLAGRPKDWQRQGDQRFRTTHPSNLWTDLTVPFWSMPENTDHPTQKPEKLLAKCILASSRPGDLVFDPFAGSGTTAVVAKKLGRRYLAVEIDETYCCLALKRLDRAETDPDIQGYVEGCFWERNTLAQQMKDRKDK